VSLSLVNPINDSILTKVGINGHQSKVKLETTQSRDHPLSLSVAIHDKFVASFQAKQTQTSVNNLKTLDKINNINCMSGPEVWETADLRKIDFF
jgi:hypothetical protein